MVSMARRYYGAPFTVSIVVTQGNPLSPTISNIVVDAVIYQWLAVLDGEDTCPQGFGRAVKKLAILFYADNNLLASPRMARL